MVEDGICKYNKYGYCKYGETCHKYHEIRKCEDVKCETVTCLLRHPTPCRHFSIYRRCKFGSYCSFEHCEETDKISFVCEIKELKSEITILKDKIDNLENVFKDKTQETNVLLERLSLKMENSNKRRDSWW